MLKDILVAVKASEVNKIIVVGSDQAVQDLAEKFCATYLEEKTADLNGSLKQGTQWSISNNAKSVLIIPADIPLVTAKEINQIIKLGISPISVVISPAHNRGTNALFQKPPNLVRIRFGANSFLKHQNEAIEKGISPIIYQSEGFALDIDSPEDLDKLLTTENRTVTRTVLTETRK
jgi:2-phospho-L-lactate guanylyltransferase